MREEIIQKLNGTIFWQKENDILLFNLIKHIRYNNMFNIVKNINDGYDKIAIQQQNS